jgi:hypothetical protein
LATIWVPSSTHPGAVGDHQSATVNYLGAADSHQGAIISCQGAVDIAAAKPKKLSLREVLIMEVIDLDIWIFTPTPRWAPTVMVCDNDLE